ncbi:MAG: hypothetical protein AAB256_04295 [Deltaproteobacteria bacterium]
MKKDAVRLSMLLVWASIVFLFVNGNMAHAHEIMGEVTPLMIHMKQALGLIEHGKSQEAIHVIRMVYEDFSHDMGMRMVMQGVGLKNTAAQVDQRFGTRVGTSLDEALAKGNPPVLEKVIQELGFLLMLEKFTVLQAAFGKASANPQTQKTIFWLGRNYFSYLLEPTLTEKNPVEALRLDRMLDSMLYRLEDGQPEEFAALQNELVSGIVAAFHLDRPPAMPAGSHQK